MFAGSLDKGQFLGMEQGVSPDEFRKALGNWPSGVTVVTVGEGEQIHGLTVSAFASVSLKPPLIFVCIDRRSRAHSHLETKPAFVVNVLAAGQADISYRFAKAGELRFEGIRYHVGKTGCPVLDETAASLECVVENSMAAGDHIGYFGRVLGTEVSRRDPLIYCAGEYRSILYGRRANER
jgi:flavin reductase (DIM6/NTAB) family NADH-FMN oxidoreductase RutF